MINKKFGVVDKKGNIIINVSYDGITAADYSVEDTDYCIEEGCLNQRAYGSEYCYTHKPTTTSNKYCKYYGCLNRVTYSWNDYCSVHSYMEY